MISISFYPIVLMLAKELKMMLICLLMRANHWLAREIVVHLVDDAVNEHVEMNQ